MPATRPKPDLASLAQKLVSEGPYKTLSTPKRIRILLNGVWVADTTSALYVWEHQYYPYYYVPLSSLAPGVYTQLPSTSADFTPLQIKVGDRVVERAVAFSGSAGGKAAELRDYVRIEYEEAEWFEEDEAVYMHPKDPFKRIDIIHSSRPIRVLIGGVEVARATSALHLFETGLPTRYYLPPTAVDQSVIRASATSTGCPYKGTAGYYDVVVKPEGAGEEVVAKDVVWYYKTPTHESAKIAGFLCFYNEKVDIELDGKLLEKPKTPFS